MEPLCISSECPSNCSSEEKPNIVPSPGISRRAGTSSMRSLESGRNISLSDSKNVGKREEEDASSADTKNGGGASRSSNGGGAPAGSMLGPASPSE